MRAEHGECVHGRTDSPAPRDHQLPLGEDSMGSDLGRTGMAFRGENTSDTAMENKPALRDAVKWICPCHFCGSLGAALQVIMRPSSSTGRISDGPCYHNCFQCMLKQFYAQCASKPGADNWYAAKKVGQYKV